MKRATMEMVEANMKRIAAGVASGFGASAEVDFRFLFAPLINDAERTTEIADAAASVVGEANVERNGLAIMASEDFSFMMEAAPGAYINIGNGDTVGSCQVHNPGYDFNDEATPYGSAMFAELVERQLPQGAV
jgi:hippurate hydrolase